MFPVVGTEFFRRGGRPMLFAWVKAVSEDLGGYSCFF